MYKKTAKISALLFCLIFLSIPAKADYPTGTLGYSDEITVGNEYTWSVSTVQFEGDFSFYSSSASIGGEVLSVGDIVKIRIIDDPDTAGSEWYEIYLNGLLLPDDSLGDLLDYGFDYISGGFFINPVTYTNTTGTYSIYEQLFEELEKNNDDYGYSDSYAYGGITYEYIYSVKIEYSLTGDVFKTYLYQYMYMGIHGGGYDLSQSIEMSTETSVNVITGLLGKIDFSIEANMMDSITVDGRMHFVINSDYATLSETPSATTITFDWVFSLIGLTIIAAVVVLTRRKR